MQPVTLSFVLFKSGVCDMDNRDFVRQAIISARYKNIWQISNVTFTKVQSLNFTDENHLHVHLWWNSYFDKYLLQESKELEFSNTSIKMLITKNSHAAQGFHGVYNNPTCAAATVHQKSSSQVYVARVFTRYRYS